MWGLVNYHIELKQIPIKQPVYLDGTGKVDPDAEVEVEGIGSGFLPSAEVKRLIGSLTLGG